MTPEELSELTLRPGLTFFDREYETWYEIIAIRDRKAVVKIRYVSGAQYVQAYKKDSIIVLLSNDAVIACEGEFL